MPQETIDQLAHFGFSGIANVLAAIKTAKLLKLTKDDAIVTVATDGAALYSTEAQKITTRDFPYGFDEVSAGETFGRFMLGQGTGDLLELGRLERERIFNLGYFTWVEQQGYSLAEFDARKSQGYWRDLRAQVPAWDAMIGAFNAAVTG